MGKVSIQELAALLVDRAGLNKKEATTFIGAIFDLVQQALETEKIVKIKGLGTFKIIDVDDRESVNVNTGERVLIEGHGKITFAPDSIIKELVNRGWSSGYSDYLLDNAKLVMKTIDDTEIASWNIFVGED